MKPRLSALAGLITALLAAQAVAGDTLLAEGRRLYRDGLRADGTPLEGWRPGGGALRGRDLACVQCHRPSGMGTVEGVSIVPPITGATLFAPGRQPTGHQPRRAAGMTLEDHAFRIRPAYDTPRLARALRQGTGAGGAPFDALMPRYTLSDREVDALAAYLNSLAATPAPGVDDTTLHLATVLAPDTEPRQQQAMLDVLRHCVAELGPRPGKGRRSWQLHTWQLEGPRAGWPAQLDAHRRRQPAFALVAGIARDWAPMHEFCEAEGLPCLFPNTDATGPTPSSSIYLWPGVALEGRVMARHLEDRPRLPRRLIQVFAADDIGRHGAAALAAALPDSAQIHIDPASPLPPLAEGDVLALWLPPAALRSFIARQPALPVDAEILVSGTLAELDRAPDATALSALSSSNLRVIYPFDEAAPRLARLVFNLGGWMSSHGLSLARDTERVQGNTWSACAVTARALYTLPSPPTREALLERVEDAYAGAVSTSFPRFTLGPGQRYGSKGAYVMKVGANGQLEADGDWIVP